MSESVDDIINSLGFGGFSWMIILIIGILWTSESSELNIVSILGAQFRCKWHLTSFQTSMTGSSVFLGAAIGSLYWGYFGDKYGRKIMLISGASLVVYFGLLSTVSPNYYWYILLRFFVGIGLSCVGFGSSYIAEFIIMKYRGKSVISVSLFYAFGSIYVAVIALLLMRAAGWRIFIAASAIPSIIFLMMSPWLPESVRYLQNTRNTKEIVKILNRISVLNKKNIPAILNIQCEEVAKRGNVNILFSKEYGWKLAIMTVVFISSYCGYYGVVMLNTELLQSQSFSDKNITANFSHECKLLTNADYMQNILVVVGEIPGVFLAGLTVDVVGRKGYLCPGFFVVGVLFLCLNLSLSSRNATILSFLLRMLLAGISQTPFVFAAELFPTVVRTTALGILLGACKLSLIGVPFLVQYLLHVSFVATTMIFAGLCFLSGGLVLLLPETKDWTLINN